MLELNKHAFCDEGLNLDSLASWVDQYGYVVLFLVVLLEMIALPVSGQTVMAYCGFLAWQERLDWVACIVIAGIGASLGMSFAYWIGYKLGGPFFNRYGSYIHLKPDKMEETSRWMERYGNFSIVFAYYIPGVRHITGYLSGITKMPFGRFALSAYTGAFIWGTVFVSLGGLLGQEWKHFYKPGQPLFNYWKRYLYWRFSDCLYG